ncbi:MAG: 50S ribosomal protein L6 [Clostridia bacterium]|nr:50S ribosomal protein L6 [Clostridia bacterium]
MSRIGRLPIVIPAGVTVTLGDNNTVTVKGSLGTLTRSFAPTMGIEVKDNHVYVTRQDDQKKNKALHGLTRVLINNMVVGVSKGYEKVLVVNGVGYKVTATGANQLTFNVGYSHPVVVTAPQGITLTCNGAEVSVKGIDKELVGQTAANIKRIRIPDPYHLYGIRYKDEVLVKKEGKTAGK